MDMQAIWLRAYVEKLLAEPLGEVELDDDGDVPFRWGTAACWVRVLERPFLHVEVFAHAALGLRRGVRLLRELNDANSRLVTGRIYEAGGLVVVEQSIPAGAVTELTLRQACTAVATTADDLGPLLAAMFDGRTPFPAEPLPFDPPSIEAEGA